MGHHVSDLDFAYRFGESVDAWVGRVRRLLELPFPGEQQYDPTFHALELCSVTHVNEPCFMLLTPSELNAERDDNKWCGNYPPYRLWFDVDIDGEILLSSEGVEFATYEQAEATAKALGAMYNAPVEIVNVLGNTVSIVGEDEYGAEDGT